MLLSAKLITPIANFLSCFPFSDYWLLTGKTTGATPDTGIFGIMMCHENADNKNLQSCRI